MMEDVRPDTHLPVDIVFSMRTLEGSELPWATYDNWGWMEFYTYISLEKGTKISQNGLNAFLNKHIGEENRKRAGLELKLQPITAIHTDAELMYGYEPVRDARIMTFLKIVGAFVLFMACINYVNLSGAIGLKRAKEVGVRKNLGASRWELIRQFSAESLLIIVLAIILAMTMIQLAWPFLAEGMGGAFTISLWSEPKLLLMALIPVFTGIFWTIVQPALIMSAFPMVAVLKGNITNFGKGKRYRKGSVIIQFAISLVLMITSFVIYRQINFLQNKDIGVNVAHKLIIDKPQENIDNLIEKADVLKQKLKSLSLVENVSYSGRVPSKGYNYSTNNLHQVSKGPNEVGEFGVNVTYIDNEYINVYQPKLLAGVGKYEGYENSNKVILNEKALIPLFFSSPEEAVGKMISDGENEYEIIGVIENYLHTSVKEESRPVMYRLDKNPQHFTIAYNAGSQPLQATKQILREAKKYYEEVFPDTNFNYTFLDEAFAAQFRYEVFFGRLVLIFTMLAIFIAALGLFGLSMFNVESKTKEVGIRKTLGASQVNLFVTNLKPFLWLLLGAAIIAVPISYYVSAYWLQDYPHKINLGIFSFIIPIVLLALITLITVSYHVIKLNKVNPVESLRYE